MTWSISIGSTIESAGPLTTRRLKLTCAVASIAIVVEALLLALEPSPRAVAATPGIPVAPALSDSRVVAAPRAGGSAEAQLDLLGQVAAVSAWAVLPQPIDSETAAIPSGGEPSVAFGIRIERIGLDTTVYSGVDLDTLAMGPGHWPGSALPGGAGNVVIGGHRVTWTRPFHDLDLLQTGDIIEVGRARYEVDRSFVVGPEDVWIVTPTPQPTITLFACHPKHSAAQRIVVTGRLVA